MRKFYSSCHQKLNASFLNVNKIRLKENILARNQNLQASLQRKVVYISYKDDLAGALQFVKDNSPENDANRLCRTASLIRNDIFQRKQQYQEHLLILMRKLKMMILLSSQPYRLRS